jgi:hypothetical protein
MSKNIVFTNIFGLPELETPKPASSHIPNWYKNTDSYIGNKKEPSGDGSSPATIKKCIPVFDAITAGYIITLPVDVHVSIKDGAPWYQWSSFTPLSFHPVEQAPEHPTQNGMPYPKWNNPWAIKTPTGYSTLFVQPFHRESPFTILPGIVDTDNYYAAVNFPFVLNDLKFEGMIPRGTPIAQAIPFKRDAWKMSLGDETDITKLNKVTVNLNTKFFDKYKYMFWNRKEYK